MTIAEVFQFSQWFFIMYFIAMHLGYLILIVLSVISIRQYMEQHTISNLPKVYTGLEIPISILVPAFNEELTVTNSVLSLLQMNYPDF